MNFQVQTTKPTKKKKLTLKDGKRKEGNKMVGREYEKSNPKALNLKANKKVIRVPWVHYHHHGHQEGAQLFQESELSKRARLVNEKTRHGYAARGTKLGFLRGGSWRELKEGKVQRKNPRPENQGKRVIYIYIYI